MNSRGTHISGHPRHSHIRKIISLHHRLLYRLLIYFDYYSTQKTTTLSLASKSFAPILFLTVVISIYYAFKVSHQFKLLIAVSRSSYNRRRCKRVWWRSTSSYDVDSCPCKMHRSAMWGAVVIVTILEWVRQFLTNSRTFKYITNMVVQ